MKRLLLLLIFAMIGNLSMAQSSMAQKMKKAHFTIEENIKQQTIAPMPIDIPGSVDGWQAPIAHENTMNYRSGILSKVKLGSSYNIYSVVSGSPNPINYNPALDALVFIHRQNDGEAGGSGIISFDVSTDGGATWDATNKPTTPNLESEGGTAINGNRYPSGTIYNPAGNTDIANAKFVGIGPALWNHPTHIGADGTPNGWGWEFVTTANLDGTNSTEDYYTSPQDSAAFLPYSLVNNADGSLWYADIKRQARTSVTVFEEQFWSPGLVTKLTFDESGDSYTREVTALPINYEGGVDSFAVSPRIEFSPDGETGYFVILGIDADDTEEFPSSKPMVWKTTDAGASWEKQSRVEYQALDSLIAWTNHVDGDGSQTITADDTLYARIPYMNQFDMTVDAEGNLHLFASLISLAETTENGVGSFWSGDFSAEIFHFISDGESWEANRVAGYYNSDAPVGSTANILDERIQASRTADGEYTFMTYAETFYDDDFTEDRLNAAPDIHAYAYRVSDGYIVDDVNFGLVPGTVWGEFQFTDILAEGFLHMTSPTAIENGENWDYELPIVTGIPSDLGNPLVAVEYWYIRGAGFDEDDFHERGVLIAVEDVEINSTSLKVQPNPASDNINVSFELLEGSKVAIDMFDMMGRKVLSAGTVDYSAGNYTKNIVLDNLAQGTYLIRLQTANQTATTKVIIK